MFGRKWTNELNLVYVDVTGAWYYCIEFVSSFVERNALQSIEQKKKQTAKKKTQKIEKLNEQSFE